MNDVAVGMNIIYASFAIVFVLGFAYMMFVRFLSGVIVWLIILLFFLFLGLLGLFIYQKSLDIKQEIKNNDGNDLGENT